jgi:hypothetical protein
MCTPFRVHLHASLPLPPKISVPEILPQDWERNLSSEIGKVQTQELFPKIYQHWLSENADVFSDQRRFEWLHCLLYYVRMDSNHNGIPDWSAISDNMPAQVLYPQDPDMDGDGVENVLDPDPLDAKISLHSKAGGIPEHLRIDRNSRPETAALQAKLFDEFGIIAIDHSDQHSPVVLRTFLFVLERGFSRDTIRGFKGLRYIYAFAGHDPRTNVASYHAQASALSVGGMKAYGNSISKQAELDLMSALAHEIGHVFIFDKMSPRELSQAGSQFGGWQKVRPNELRDAFYSQAFFEPYAEQKGFLSLEADLKKNNIVSKYAMTNIHEWFAEAFAGVILRRLGAKLAHQPDENSDYWTNYSNLSDGFVSWLEAKI